MLTPSVVEDTRDRLCKHKGRYPEIARSAGLSYSWLAKFGQGLMSNPAARRLAQLQGALDELEAESTPPGAGAEAPH